MGSESELRDKIIVALDVEGEEKLLPLLESLKGEATFVKIGMELFYAMGERSVFLAQSFGFKVFLDLKLHDIPNTVTKAMNNLLKLPIEITNVHAQGGLKMMEEVANLKNKLNSKVKIIAVTQLTSTDVSTLNLELQIPFTIEQSVLNLATLTKKAGLDGVVCSPLEIDLIKSNLGKNFLTITPGIRPVSSLSHDQKRILTPQEAFNKGTDYIVVGRPITESPHPQMAFQNILRSLT